jgi:peptide-methionine (S)-S-oxide reductase
MKARQFMITLKERKRTEPEKNQRRKAIIARFAVLALPGMAILAIISLLFIFESFGTDRKEEVMFNTAIKPSAPKVEIPPIDAAAPVKTETATFALGWFWGPDAQFGSIKGVVRTRVGYSGGEKKDPTYYHLGDHTETIQIDYDPTVISYKELLDVFWRSHDPTLQSWSRQYMNIIFYHNEGQKRLAMETRDREAAREGAAVQTKILPATRFYPAEPYHQKYQLRRERDIMGEFKAMYPDDKGFVDSTAAARVNGFLGGYGGPTLLQEELDSLGLSPEAGRKLSKIVSARSRR